MQSSTRSSSVSTRRFSQVNRAVCQQLFISLLRNRTPQRVKVFRHEPASHKRFIFLVSAAHCWQTDGQQKWAFTASNRKCRSACDILNTTETLHCVCISSVWHRKELPLKSQGTSFKMKWHEICFNLNLYYIFGVTVRWWLSNIYRCIYKSYMRVIWTTFNIWMVLCLLKASNRCDCMENGNQHISQKSSFCAPVNHDSFDFGVNSLFPELWTKHEKTSANRRSLAFCA